MSAAADTDTITYSAVPGWDELDEETKVNIRATFSRLPGIEAEKKREKELTKKRKRDSVVENWRDLLPAGGLDQESADTLKAILSGLGLSKRGKREDLLQRLRDQVIKDAGGDENEGGGGGEDVNVEKEASPTEIVKEVNYHQPAPPVTKHADEAALLIVH